MPHEAVPEVSKSNLYINQKKNDAPIEIIVGDILNTSHFGQLHFAQPFFAELFFDRTASVLNCYLLELLLY